MATVFKRKGSPYYYGKYRLNGKQHVFSTEQSDKGKALKVMDKHRARNLAEASAGELIARAHSEIDRASDSGTERDREQMLSSLFDRVLSLLDKIEADDTRESKRREMVEALRQGQQDRLRLADAWDAFKVKPRKQSTGASQMAIYRGWWNAFLAWMETEHEAVKHLDQVRPASAEAYATHLWADGISERTYNGKVSCLRLIFRTVKTDAGLTANVWDGIELKHKDTRGRRALTLKELQAVCGKATGVLRYWLALGLYTGLRLKDVVTLQWSAISFDDHTLTFVAAKTRKKNHKAETVFMHPTLEALLLELKQAAGDSEYCFPEYATDYDTTGRHKAGNLLKAHWTACGIKTTEKADADHRKQAASVVGFHSLRHTFVSLAAAKNVPQAVLQDLVGHKSAAMTATYTHTTEAARKAAIKKLPASVFDATEKPAKKRRKKGARA